MGGLAQFWQQGDALSHLVALVLLAAVPTFLLSRVHVRVSDGATVAAPTGEGAVLELAAARGGVEP